MNDPSNVDGVLLPWSTNFSARISLTPTVFSLTAADATAYAALHADFVTRLAAADTPATRTKAIVAAKNQSKANLLAKARQFAKVIKASPTVTDAQRADLGLPARDLSPTPVPPPTTRPTLLVDPFGNVELHDEATPTKRGKPKGTMAAVLFAKLADAGAAAPATPDDAKYVGVATKDRFAIPVSPADAGKVLWVLAQWVNTKGQPGPVSPVASSRIAA